MKYKLGLSLLAGLIIGGILGAYFFMFPADFLVCGPLPEGTIIIPPETHAYILKQTLYFGIIPGAIIGLLGGYNTDMTLPRGHLSKNIGLLCFIVCTILAYVTQGHFLEHTPVKKIFLTVLMTFFIFIFSIPISGFFSFIEKIRE